MNLWLLAAAALLLGLIPCCVGVLRGRVMDRFVALQMAQIVVVLSMVMMAEGFKRSIYLDIPLALAVLALAGGLVFVRFLERWL
jgi:multicomponent Na+:H+ antiporter subunit F